MELLNYKRPTQLFLRGVHIKDCLNNMGTLNAISTAPGISVEITYDRLPNKFISPSEWPASTNLKCWHCDCNFAGSPMFIALSITSNFEAAAHGNFCTIFCAAGYLENHNDPKLLPKKKWEYLEMLKVIYKLFTGKMLKQIFPAPPKTVMIQYGGTKTVDEYKKFLKELEENSLEGLTYNSAPSIIKQYF